MTAWEYVINTAMLGTDKPMPGMAVLPDEVAEVAAMIDSVELSDKEEIFLQKAAAVYNYRQCGFTPIEQVGLPVAIASEETKPYCSEAAAGILHVILNEENNTLLELWLRLCHEGVQLLFPDVLPAVLDLALKDKFLQPLAIACSGNRGLWLSKLNLSWDYFCPASDEELWQTGKPEERVNVLKGIRQTNPAQAREWLQQTWAQEAAASKVDLLKVLRINVSDADLEWLEGLLNEKGQKVKDEVLGLLKLIPGSSIVKQYQDLLRASVILKKEKALFGMMTKVSIQQKLPDMVDEYIFKSGIEKLAGQKSAFTDEGFILYQLIARVPPSFWEGQFEATPAQVFEYFNNYANDKLPALGLAASRFNQKEWVAYFLNQPVFYGDFLNMMTFSEQEDYLVRFLNTNPQGVIPDALRLNREWGPAFAIAALGEMANYPYEYNRAFFNKYIGLIPVSIISQLEKIKTRDPNLQNAWEKGSYHLIKLLGLKQQTLKAFNA